jgi:hypothetical protein
LVTLLKFINALIQVSYILGLSVSFKFINFGFQTALFLFLKCLLASRLTLFRLPMLLWFGSCTNCILACFLWSKNMKYSSSNLGLCWFYTYRPTLSVTDVLVFSFMSSKALYLSSLSLKFSKEPDLLEMLIWYYFLNSNSLSFLRLNLSTSNVCPSCLLTVKFSLI